MGKADELRNVIAAGPFTWAALDKVEGVFEEAVQLLADLASDPGFTGEAANAASSYAESLRGDYLEALRGIDASRLSLERANAAWATALRKYSTFDNKDDTLIHNAGEAVAAVMTGGMTVVFHALGNLFGGEDDDDRGEDGLAQLQNDLGSVPSEPYEMNMNTGRVPPPSPPSGSDYSNTPPPYPGYDPGAYSGGNPGDFGGAGAGLAIDGPGAGIGSGAGGGMGGGLHGAGVGAGGAAGAALGGVGMLGAGVGAGAAGAAAAGALAGRGGMMGGGGGMGGGGASEEGSSKRASSGLKAPELEEDDEKAPRSEGAAAGGRMSLPDQAE